MLKRLLKPLVGKTIYYVKNMARGQFSKQLRDMMVEEDEIMNSHDVVSFTNVPIDKVMAVIRKWLDHDKTPSSRTNLTPDDVMSLL